MQHNRSNQNTSQRRNNQFFSSQAPTEPTQPNSTRSSTERAPNGTNTYCTFNQNKHVQILLATVLVQIQDNNGDYITVRGILDSGSQSNFITERLVQRLKLKKTKHQIPLQGINQVNTNTTHCVSVNLKSRHNNWQTTIDCAVLPKITSTLPTMPIDKEALNIPSECNLADDTFHIPSQVDILLGAQISFDIIKEGKLVKPGNYPVLQNTVLGWILGGKINISQPPTNNTQHSLFVTNQLTLEQQLQRFWEIESLEHPPRSKAEKQCELHFQENTIRTAEGRFLVRLPLKSDVQQLGDSRQSAQRRFTLLEKRLSRDPALRQQYNEFMNEYFTMGHMRRVSSNSTTNKKYYLPHHPVFKESSSTTKMRVVFDASAKSNSGLSLNDILHIGPTIQQDLYSIMLRFRTHPICFTSDIAKMYRQISMHSEDCDLQRILWRNGPTEETQEYQLTTVTYGTASAPFLATRCLQQLALDEQQNFPQAAQILLNDTYVDDIISGADTEEEAIQLQEDLTTLLSKGGFPLRKWSSNNTTFLHSIPEHLRENKSALQFDFDQGVKALGILWYPAMDKFQITFNFDHFDFNNMVITKRAVLSVISAIFDPLGLISPVVIPFKIFMQSLWQVSSSWDEELSTDLQHRWKQLQDTLATINNLQVDRRILCNCPTSIELHGFCDASEKAYGACIYIKSFTSDGKPYVKLVCSKSRVAPLKKISLPRLELCGALLLARLYKKTIAALNLLITHIYMWTDSTVVLTWITGDSSRWKTFVANRVSEIQDSTPGNVWRHVPSSENPADLISRGCSSQALASNTLWWAGPHFLLQSSDHWPSLELTATSQSIPEQRICLVANTSTFHEVICKFSSLSRLVRVIAYCLRFCYNCKNKSARHTTPLSAAELDKALLSCIFVVQHSEYKCEIQDLSTGDQLSSKSKIKSLHPFLDEQSFLRVGGRLRESQLSFEAKHQLILPSKHNFTRLLIRSEHLRLLHAESKLLISSLRMKYWIPAIKQTVKSIIHNCHKCFRYKAEVHQQLMGSLPAPRVQPARAFRHVGIDMAGPILTKPDVSRSKIVNKSYVALFVCFCTKAVHLELVSNLTTDAFLAAFRRFISRRGTPTEICSDNGTNFIGAARELQELQQFLQSPEHLQKVQEFFATEKCTWKFIPPRAPHFGGLWEAAVKSMKHHLRRVLGQTIVTFEELTTLLTQIEACLNSRPLCSSSDDPDNQSYLTPAHFLIGEPLTRLPEPNYIDIPSNRLSRWHLLQKFHQDIWKQWSRDYLHTLQQRSKWKQIIKNLQVNDIVLLYEENVPHLQWKTGIIETTHPGKDGLVRMVTVRTSNGVIPCEFNQAISPTISDFDEN